MPENKIDFNDSNIVKCLDQGFVRLIEVMGDDVSVVQAARVSYGKGTKTKSEDRGLINYLLKNEHTSPFEMVEFKFHCRMPIFVARQWVRHRTASINEISGRYSVMDDHFWRPEDEDVRKQDNVNRQGSTNDLIVGNEAQTIKKNFEMDQKTLYEHYTYALDKGMARELARANLPLATYTEWYWKIDLHNLMRFLKLRLDWHAQEEIRVYARAIAGFVKRSCPLCWEAFEEHLLYASKLSRAEWETVKKVLDRHDAFEEVIEERKKDLKSQGASEWKIREETSAMNRAFKKEKLL